MRARTCLLLCVLWASAGMASELSERVDRLRALTPRVSGGEAPAPAACRRPGRDAAVDRSRIERAIRDASLRFGVSRGLIRAVIRTESAGNPEALSSAGAMGLMQLMPATARSLGVVCAYEPRQNVMGGTRLLRTLRDDLGSWRLALAAYHAGPARARSGEWPAETKRYVDDVMRRWKQNGDRGGHIAP